MKLLTIGREIIVTWPNTSYLVLLLFSLLCKFLLICIEVYLIEKWPNTLRFKSSRCYIIVLEKSLRLIICSTNIANTSHLQILASRLCESWPYGSFDFLFCWFLLRFFIFAKRHFYIFIYLYLSNHWYRWFSFRLLLYQLTNFIHCYASLIAINFVPTLRNLFGTIFIQSKIHCPGPIDGKYSLLNLFSSLWKEAVPIWPSLTITLLFFLRIVCTIGIIKGKLTS